MSDAHEPSLGRRAAVRLLIWGATGLSFLPGCLRGRHRRVNGDLLARWARLGEVWREMSGLAHLPYTDGSFEPKLARLQEASQAALDAVKASAELRHGFDERLEFISVERKIATTCYDTALPFTTHDAAGRIHGRAEELEQLAKQGKLTQPAANKAARAMAVDLEVSLQAGEAPSGAGERYEAWRKIDAAFAAGEIAPREGAAEAGERLVELTVDDIGLLAGMPEEGVDQPDGAPAPNEEDDA